MNKFTNRLSLLLTIIIIICLAVSGFLLVKSYLDYRHTEELVESMQSASETVPQPSSGTAPSEGQAVSTPPAASAAPDASTVPAASMTPGASAAPDAWAAPAAPAASTAPDTPNPYKDSFLANEDMAAWLAIPGTDIDYPVMWTPEDENYYLYRSFDGKDNKNGCLILDTDSCLDPLTTNLIIHGHNMRSGAMFGNLTDYEKKDYYEDHKQITLYTEGCRRDYEVIAVFRSQVYKKTDQVFKFYKFFQADTEEEFDDFYQNIKALSLYDTGVTAEFGDHFLTLSTCVYHVEQGRFVVVAKEVSSEEQYAPFR